MAAVFNATEPDLHEARSWEFGSALWELWCALERGKNPAKKPEIVAEIDSERLERLSCSAIKR